MSVVAGASSNAEEHHAYAGLPQLGCEPGHCECCRHRNDPSAGE